MQFDLAVCNGIILSPHNRYVPSIGSIGIREGLIEYVGEKIIHPQETREIIDAAGKIVMPGLVNGHCHGDMAFARGMGDDLTLREQNEVFSETNWFHDLTTDEDRYYSRLLTYVEAILSGTTFLLDNTFWSLGQRSFEAMNSVGIKGGIVQDVVSDFADPDALLSTEELSLFRQACCENQIVPVLGGILEESFQDARLKKMAHISSKMNCLMTSHLCETTWRHEIVEETFKTSSVVLLERYGILNQKYIGSHAIYLSQEDLLLFARNNAKVVNTPLCEMKIADGIAPIPGLIKHGVVVGLGTDGAMWNNSNDIFREMKGMALLHTISSGIRSLSTHDILDMATIKGAEVFGLEKEIGSIEEGKKADIILVDACQPHMAPIRVNAGENVSSALVFCATGRDVTDVIVNGNHLVQNGRLLTVNVKDIIDQVATTSERIALYFSGGERKPTKVRNSIK
ncbi:MAG: amidohydrolase family protein [Anaerolineaceae bacterium]